MSSPSRNSNSPYKGNSQLIKSNTSIIECSRETCSFRGSEIQNFIKIEQIKLKSGVTISIPQYKDLVSLQISNSSLLQKFKQKEHSFDSICQMYKQSIEFMNGVFLQMIEAQETNELLQEQKIMKLGKRLSCCDQNPFINTYLLNLKFINKRFKIKMQDLEQEVKILKGTIKFLIQQIPHVIQQEKKSATTYQNEKLESQKQTLKKKQEVIESLYHHYGRIYQEKQDLINQSQKLREEIRRIQTI